MDEMDPQLIYLIVPGAMNHVSDFCRFLKNEQYGELFGLDALDRCRWLFIKISVRACEETTGLHDGKYTS
jgi:hypothetical protein